MRTIFLKEVNAMKIIPLISVRCIFVIISTMGILYASEAQRDFSPKPDEQQLPTRMHSEMKDLPRITVGRKNAQMIGADNRVLQAAVDYIAGLGRGTVEIGEGEYRMYDSLHLRANVTVRGKKGKTILTATSASSRLRSGIRMVSRSGAALRFGIVVPVDFTRPWVELQVEMETRSQSTSR